MAAAGQPSPDFLLSRQDASRRRYLAELLDALVRGPVSISTP